MWPVKKIKTIKASGAGGRNIWHPVQQHSATLLQPGNNSFTTINKPLYWIA
jgi:hypothetical protein